MAAEVDYADIVDKAVRVIMDFPKEGEGVVVGRYRRGD